MALYRLEAVLFERITKVMEEAGIPYKARMSMCSKVCGRTIFQWNDLTSLEAIHIIDYVTKESEITKYHDANKSRRKHKKAHPANDARRIHSNV